MSDMYFDRIAAVQKMLVEQAHAPQGDRELRARLVLPHPAEALYAPPPADVRSETVDAGGHPIPIRVYRPHELDAQGAVLIWCHGGAFLGGDLDMPEADAVAREVAIRAAATVVSVDYRLCIDGVHYPAPNDDLHRVIRWVHAHAAAWKVDPGRISIGGASAGACLAAGAALRARDERIDVASVVLAYPIVHPVLPPPTDELAGKLAGLDAGMAFAPQIIEPVMENYLGLPAADAPEYAAAGVSENLTDLPPTLIINCEYDGLRASGERYAQQLEDVGVDVRIELAEGVAHGHLNRPGLPVAQRSLRSIAEWITLHRAGMVGVP